MSESNISEQTLERLNSLFPREARWAYFQKNNGPMFIYNTERIHTRNKNDVANGKFESAVAAPYGRGSRTGKAKTWEIVKESRSLHVLRKDAKARAYKLYKTWQETGKIDA